MYMYVYCLSIHLGLVLYNVGTTFNNISCILWQSILLVDETRIPGEHHRLQTTGIVLYCYKSCIK